MSLTVKLVLFAAFIGFMLLMASSYRKRKKKIIFFGDSITEAGALFGGYIQRIATYMQNEDVAAKYDLAGMGKSGNKAVDLLARMDKDILERGADLVLIFIGINDVWQKYKSGEGTSEKQFGEAYKSMLEKLRIADIKFILCSPTVIGERIFGENEADHDLEVFSGIIKKLGEEFEVPVVDLRSAFKNQLAILNLNNDSQGILTYDGVHLNEQGNRLVASEIWEVMKVEISSLK